MVYPACWKWSFVYQHHVTLALLFSPLSSKVVWSLESISQAEACNKKREVVIIFFASTVRSFQKRKVRRQTNPGRMCHVHGPAKNSIHFLCVKKGPILTSRKNLALILLLHHKHFTRSKCNSSFCVPSLLRFLLLLLLVTYVFLYLFVHRPAKVRMRSDAGGYKHFGTVLGILTNL